MPTKEDPAQPKTKKNELTFKNQIHESIFLITRVGKYSLNKILGWPKCSFKFFQKMLWENSKELFSQSNTKKKHTTQEKADKFDYFKGKLSKIKDVITLSEISQ